MRKVFISSILILYTLIAYSQDFGTVNYMGKKIPITTEFFKDFNKWFEVRGSQADRSMYSEIVNLLKSKTTTIFIDEAKSISWKTEIYYPYCENCKAKKRDKQASARIMYNVFLPLIDFYEENYN